MTDGQRASSGNPFRAILDVGAALVSSLELESVFANVAEKIGQAMVVWGVEIQVYDPERAELVHQAFWCDQAAGDAVPRPAGAITPLDERPSLDALLHADRTVERHLSDPDLPADERRFLEAAGYKTALYAPLAVGGEALGVIALIERRFVRRFTPIEIDLFRQLSDLASIAIHNADLYERLDEQKRHTGSLLEASQALTASLDLEDVMTLVADGVHRALGVGSVDIYEYREADDALVAVASVIPDRPDEAAEWLGTVLPLADHPSFRRVFERHQVVEYHVDDPGLPDLDRELYDEMCKWGEKSVIEAGLVFGDEIMGCVSLCTFRAARHLSEDERDLLVALASTAAMAIRNAKMFRKQTEQNRHRSSLLDAGRAITSTVVLHEVLSRITREATNALQASQAAIYYYDEAADTITYKALFESVPSPAPDDSLESVYQLDDYPGDRAVLLARGPVVHQLADPELSPDRREGMAAYDEYTTLNIPLWFADEPLGILRLYEMEQPRRYSEAEIELAAGLGEQAAIAIHNARMYETLDAQRRRMHSLLNINRALASSLDRDGLFATIVHDSAEALGAPRAIIHEYDDLAETLTPRSYFQLHESPGYDTTGVTQPVDRLPAARAILTGREPVVQQVSDDDLDVQARGEMLQWGEHTCLRVPLVFRGHSLGILTLVWTEKERPLTADEIEFARGIGEQAAIALFNTRAQAAAEDVTRSRGSAPPDGAAHA
jgi:GAF domain-containing protein